MEEARADKNASRDRGMGMLPGPYRALGLKPFHQMMIDQGQLIDTRLTVVHDNMAVPAVREACLGVVSISLG